MFSESLCDVKNGNSSDTSSLSSLTFSDWKEKLFSSEIENKKTVNFANKKNWLNN